jgi:predicted lipoprotein with Yx(FWY)xxD motif
MMRIRRSVATAVALLVTVAACGPAEDDASAAPGAEPADGQATSDADDTGDAAVGDDADDETTGDDETDDDATGDTTDAATADGPADDGVVVDTAATDLGTILVDGDGMTLYLFDNDTDGESVCYGDCAVTWPPLLGEATVSGDADGSLLDATEREDGAMQVTYAGMPLYYFAGDEEPGDVLGQAVGGVWWVVGPDGERITEEAAAAPAVGGY